MFWRSPTIFWNWMYSSLTNGGILFCRFEAATFLWLFFSLQEKVLLTICYTAWSLDVYHVRLWQHSVVLFNRVALPYLFTPIDFYCILQILNMQKYILNKPQPIVKISGNVSLNINILSTFFLRKNSGNHLRVPFSFLFIKVAQYSFQHLYLDGSL